jgi:hypothetical protein
MSTVESAPSVAQIGETAGLVWKTLAENGPATVAKLVKASGQPRDLVMQAIGWLAREDKIVIETAGRNRTIALR